ncbi:MAG: hypothetical protein ACE5J0_03025 [Candidatus Paceibacterales bacterium]
MKNTKREGKFTLFVYQEKPNYYIGVNLDFDLIQEGKTAPETMERIKEASLGYLETVIKKNLSNNLLNRPAPEEYWKKYRTLLRKRAEAKKLIPWNQYFQDFPYTRRSLKQLSYA